MERNIRRALYTALVAGGLVVVGASSAYAAVEGLPDHPVTQGTTHPVETGTVETGTAEGTGPAGGVLEPVAVGASPAGEAADAGPTDNDAVVPDAAVVPSAPAADVPVPYVPVPDGGAVDGVADDIAGRDGIVGSILEGDVTGVVEGALGEEGLVDGLLEGVPPIVIEVPELDAPGTLDPGAEDPGTGEPGTEEPAPHAPGTGGHDPDGSGAGEPGGHGTGRPATDVVPTSVPRTGADEAPGAADEPTAGRPGNEPQDNAAPGAPGAPGARAAGTSGSAAGPVGPVGVEGPASSGPAPVPARTGDQRGEGVDIAWGDRSDAALAAYDGTILPVGVDDALRSTLTGYDGQQAASALPGDSTARTGPMITGQLALVLLLLGLGLAVLRTCRRPDVV